MRLCRRTHLYLSSVLLLVLFYSFFDYFSGTFHRGLVIFEDNGKQSILFDTLSEEEKGVVEKHPASRIIGGMKINVNEAGAAALSALPGISWNIAENITNYRETHGLFKRYEDLLNVKGIKGGRLRTIKPFIEF